MPMSDPGHVAPCHTVLCEQAASLLDRLRSRAPRVHSITNTVAQNFTANVLLALGATPSMTSNPEEIAEFVAYADAVLINIGLLDSESRAGIRVALTALTPGEGRTPPRFVLDPAFVNASPARAAFAQEIIAARPAAIRLNATETATLSGLPSGTAAAVAAFARRTGTVIAETGAVDHVSDGTRIIAIANGHPMMARVTATGCALSAVVAAALAVEEDAVAAAAGALALYAVAGEIAVARSQGAGSFVPAFLDTLDRLGADEIRRHARMSEDPPS